MKNKGQGNTTTTITTTTQKRELKRRGASTTNWGRRAEGKQVKLGTIEGNIWLASRSWQNIGLIGWSRSSKGV